MAENLTPDKAPDWIAWITNFDNTRKLFVENYRALKALRPWVAEKHPELLAQHDAIMKKFTDQIPAVDNLTNLRNTVGGWIQAIGGTIQNALNFTGVQAGIDWLKKSFGLHGLAAVQIVPVAITLVSATAAMIAIAQMIADAGMYSQRLAMIKAFEEKGYTPEQAAAYVNAAVGPPKQPKEDQFLGLPIKELLFGVVAIVLGPPIIKAITEGRK